MSKLLGRGAQASVYVASESNDSPAAANSENTAQLLPQKFALKVFSQWAKPEELQQEATVLEKLSGNPHILQMHGFLESRAKVQIPRSLPEHDNDTFAQWRRGTTTKEKLSVLALELCKHGDFFSYVEKYGAIKD